MYIDYQSPFSLSFSPAPLTVKNCYCCIELHSTLRFFFFIFAIQVHYFLHLLNDTRGLKGDIILLNFWFDFSLGIIYCSLCCIDYGPRVQFSRKGPQDRSLFQVIGLSYFHQNTFNLEERRVSNKSNLQENLHPQNKHFHILNYPENRSSPPKQVNKFVPLRLLS